MTIDELLKDREDDIQASIEEGNWVVMLNQPATVTVKTSSGTFRKLPLIGEEEFIATACYMGKRGKMIFVFQPADPAAKYAYMEMDTETCIEKLDDFKSHLDGVVGDVQKKVVREKRKARLREQKALVEQKVETYGETFGSW